jgi:probable O-glycosylation ligase (exosortase A-associated)
MRANILLIVVVFLCIIALIKPRIGLYTYIWFGLMRPDYMAFAVGRFNLSTLIALVTLVSAARALFNLRYLWKPIPILLILFQLVIAISADRALVPDHAWSEFNRYLRMIIMCLLIPVLVTKEEEFRELFLVTAGSLGFLGFWWGLTAGMRGMRIYYGPGGFIGDNNGFAIALVMVVPFCWHARTLVKAAWAKMVFAAMMAGSIVTIVLTFSRGGAVALAVSLLLLISRSKNRVRSLVLIGLALLPVLGMVGAAYSERLSTIETYEEDASAVSRIVQMQIAYEIWKQHPVLGIGIGDLNYLYASRPYLTREDANVIVHNSFLQVLVHTGIFGFLCYLLMLLIALGSCWRTGWKLWKTDPDRAVMPMAIFIALVGYSVGSMTHPRAWFDFFYMLLMYSSTWSGIMQRRPHASAAGTTITIETSRHRPSRWQIPQPAALN